MQTDIVLFAQSFSCVRLFEAPWTIAHWAPLSMEFSQQEYWSGLPSPSRGDLPDLPIKPAFPTSPALPVGSFPLVPLGKPADIYCAVLSHSVVSDSFETPARILCPWGFSRQEYWVGFHALLQGILLTQGSNPGLLHCRWVLYHLSHQGSPTDIRILE